jgi:ElaB/YqjD/DUF883 family membrane-anchored ribosome-binding protein
MADHTTDPGGRSPAEIEREVDAERARVADTIEALQDKMSPNSMMDQTMRTLSEYGEPVGRNLGAMLRDNPVPAILTGVGLIWLIASGSRRHDYDYDDDRYDYYRRGYDSDLDWDDEDMVAEPLPSGAAGVSAQTGRRSSGFGERASGALRGVSERASGAFRSASERASSAMRGTSEGASSTWSGASESASRAWSSAAEGASGAAASMAERGRRASGAMRRYGRDATERARDMRYRARDAGREARETFEELVDDHPLMLAGLALALGAAIGGALPRTRTEDEYLGEHSRRLKEGIRSAAEQEGRKAYATARAVADEARTMAEESASGVARESSSMVDRAEEAVDQSAERLRDRAKEEAEAQRLGKPDTST